MLEGTIKSSISFSGINFSPYASFKHIQIYTTKIERIKCLKAQFNLFIEDFFFGFFINWFCFIQFFRFLGGWVTLSAKTASQTVAVERLLAAILKFVFTLLRNRWHYALPTLATFWVLCAHRESLLCLTEPFVGLRYGTKEITNLTTSKRYC